MPPQISAHPLRKRLLWFLGRLLRLRRLVLCFLLPRLALALLAVGILILLLALLLLLQTINFLT